MQQAPPPSAVRPTADRPYDPSQPGRTGRCCVHGGDRPGPHPPSAPEELAAYSREVTTVAARLVGAGTPPADITRFLTSAYDALDVRAARDGEAALGPAPCPDALLVLGSGARRESTLRTDQDHALVVADGAPPGADGWFAALAEHLAATQEQCGLVRCPGTTPWPPTRPGRCVGCTAARAFVGNEVEHPMDWSMEDELALYLCHGVGTSSAVMLGAAVVDQQG
jgi:hypothetical protein